jgi:hypothetical protein
VSTKGTDLAATSAIGSSNATGILSRPNSLLASSAVGTSNAVGTLKGAHVPLASAAGAVGVGSTTGFLSVGTEKTETMHDEFPSGVNSSNWTTTGLVDSSGMGWRPGSVRIQMLSTGSALTSLNQFTLHESYVMAQIFPQQIDVNHSFNFGVVGPSGSYIVIKTVGNTIVAEMRTTAGVVWTGTARPYDRIQEAWLRIRETAGLVFFEYSKDAVTWITMENHVATAGPPLSPVNIRIAAASTLPSENTFPRVVIVDNLNVVPTPPPQTETLIDFFNSSIDLTKWTVTNTTWEAGRAKMTGTAAMDSKGSFTLIDSSLVAEFNSAIATSQLAFKLLGQAGPSIGGGFGNEMGFQVGPLTSGKRTVNAYVTVNGVTTFGATVQLGTGGGSVPTNVTLGQAFGGFSMPLEQVQGSVSDATLDTQATTIADIGAGYIRGDYPAYLTEPTQGNFNFTSADRWIVNALSHGLKPVPVCYMLPGWMNGASDDKTPPTNNALYGDWCAAVAQHLWSLGVKHMELWNEQNLSGFWAGQPATDAAYRQKYAAMLADAYPKIKAVAPGMTVISGGVSTADTVFQAGVAPQNRGALSTLQRYGELGLYSHCDAVAWHPYLDSDRPCVDVGGWPAMNLASYQAALAYLDQYAPGRNLQIWTTETGCPRTVSGGATTQQTVGHNLWQMVMGGGCCVTIKDRMGPFFWFTVHDRTTGDSREDGFGFKTANFATKYAIYDTVKTDFAAIYSTTGGGGGTGDPSIDIWLRMREVSGTVVWEYATDPTNFTILWTAPANTAPPLQPLTVEVVST